MIRGLNSGTKGFDKSLVRLVLCVVCTNYYNTLPSNNGPNLGLHDGMSRVFSYSAVNLLKPFHNSCAI